MELLNDFKKLLTNEGADLVGFCSLGDIPKIKEKGFNSGVSIAIAMNPNTIKELNDGPTLEYYNEYNSLKVKLESFRMTAAKYLEDNGYKTAIGDVFNKANYTMEFPHKTAAAKAGLGWIGKCTLLVTEEFGSAILLTSLLSNFNYEEPNNKSVKVLCSQCTECVENCPGNAIKGQNWVQGVTREKIFDFNKCRQAARKIAKEKIGVDHTFCGRCMAVCPFTRRYIEKQKSG